MHARHAHRSSAHHNVSKKPHATKRSKAPKKEGKHHHKTARVGHHRSRKVTKHG